MGEKDCLMFSRSILDLAKMHGVQCAEKVLNSLDTTASNAEQEPSLSQSAKSAGSVVVNLHIHVPALHLQVGSQDEHLFAKAVQKEIERLTLAMSKNSQTSLK